MAVHVRYDSWCISLPSSAKQQRQRPNSALSGEREPRRLIFHIYSVFVIPCKRSHRYGDGMAALKQ